MARTYTLKQRAQQQADTRQRIVEAAVNLHSTVGPAATTVSMIAERAGVQRHTVYAHFPDDRSLFLACSAFSVERAPLPDAAPWRAIADPEARLRTGLGKLYDWYARNEGLAGCVLRDSETHALTKEVADLRIGPSMQSYSDVLGAGFDARQRAILQLALSFASWRTLRDSGLSQAEMVETMVQAVAGGRQTC